MGLREGFGDKLADGSYRLCESYGVPELSMTVKKQELPAYDPEASRDRPCPMPPPTVAAAMSAAI